MQPLDIVIHHALNHELYDGLSQERRLLQDFPVLTKEKVRSFFERLPSRDRHGSYLSPTSGTTGDSYYFPTRIAENREQRARFAKIIYQRGLIRDEDFVLNIFPSIHGVRALEIFTEFGASCNATVLPLGAETDSHEIFAAMAQFQPTVLAGIPSRLMSVVSWMRKKAVTFPIPKIVFGGEHVHPAETRALREVFSCESILGVYGSAELGILAYQDDTVDGRSYRFPHELSVVEVTNPDPSGIGNLTVTNLIRRHNPLVRFDTGDLAKLVQTTDGDTIVEIFERNDDGFSIGTDHFRVRRFSEVLDQFEAWQLILEMRDGREHLTFLLSGCGQRPHDKSSLFESLKKLMNLDHQLYSFDVELTTCDAKFERTRSTGKIRSLVDRRERKSD